MSQNDTEDEGPIPPQSYDLIELLDKLHPPRPTRLGRMLRAPGNPATGTEGRYMTAEEIAHGDIRYAGMRDLIDELVAWMNQEIAEAKADMPASDQETEAFTS